MKTILNNKYKLVKKLIGNLRGCRISEYLQLSAQILLPLYLTPISYDDSPYRWLIHVKVSTTSVSLPYLSEFRLIQPQDGISVLPLPITRSKESLLYIFRKYILQSVVPRYCQRLAEYQLTTSLRADYLMGFSSLPIIQSIPY